MLRRQLSRASLVLVLAGVCAGIWPHLPPQAATLTVCCAFGLIAIMVVSRERRLAGAAGAISPLSLYATFWFVYFGVFGLGILNQGTYQAPIPFDTDTLIKASLMLLVSLLLVVLGYTAIVRRPIRQMVTDPTLHVRNATVSIYVLLLVGWVSRIYRIQSGSFGYLSFGNTSEGLLDRAATLGDGLLLLALSITVLIALKKGKSIDLSSTHAKWILFANLPLLVVTAFASGLRGQLITDLVPAGAMYVLARGRLPWKGLLLVGLYVVFIFGGVGRFRADIASGLVREEERTSLGGALNAVTVRTVRAWIEEPVTEHVDSLVDNLSAEYAQLTWILASITELTPDPLPYLGAGRYAVSPIFFLSSRSLGLTLNLGQYVSLHYAGSTATSSWPPTQPGDFFLAGGWPLVVLGEIGVGAFLGLLWVSFLKRNSSRALLLYATLTPFFANAGLDWGGLSRGVVQYFFFYGGVLIWLMPSVRREGQVSLPALSKENESLLVPRPRESC